MAASVTGFKTAEDDGDTIVVLSSDSSQEDLYEAMKLYPVIVSTSSVAHKLTIEQTLGLRPKPKRPLTAFFRFSQEVVRPSLMKNNPNLPVTEVTKVASLKWKEADEVLKKKLKDDYETDMVQYRVAMKGYQEELSKVDQGELLKLQQEVKTKKEKNEKKKQRFELGCPKRPMSSFFLYLQKRKTEIPNPASQKDLVRAVSEEWKTLAPAEKAKYQEMQAAHKLNYEKEMELWERGMRESGNSHLLSPSKSKKRPRSE